MVKSPAMRAASYARQSTMDQQTITTQLQLCRRLIDERGWHETHRLTDNALKGRDPTRPGYQRLLDLIEDERIDVIITWRFDRLFRSLKEASAAHEFAEEHNVSFVSVTEPFDTTTSIGRFLFGNLANFAQFETDLLKERANLGYERRVSEGKWTGAHPPYGYQKTDRGYLSIHPDESHLIKRMINHYKRLGGDRMVAKHYNSLGLHRRGSPWSTHQVRRALTNPLLGGTLTQRGITSHQPQLAILTPRQQRQHAQHRAALHGIGLHKPQERNNGRLDAILAAYIESINEDPGAQSRNGS